MPQPLALGALHPTAVLLRLRRLHMRPELGLRHGHQRWRGDRQVVVVLVLLRLVRRLVLRLGGRRVLRGRLQRGLLLRLRRGLVWRRKRGVQGPLQVWLCVRGQEWLSRPRQEGLSRRNERPCGSRPWLAKMKQAHGTWRLQGGPHGPLSGEHWLLSLLIKRWSRLSEW